MDCSKAENYLTEQRRMCDFFCSRHPYCAECPMNENASCRGISCLRFQSECPKEAIRIVQEWSDENPSEIDWMKVPVGIKVLVKDLAYENESERIFVCYMPNRSEKFCTFLGESTQETATDVYNWRCCRLHPSVDPAPYLKEV